MILNCNVSTHTPGVSLYVKVVRISSTDFNISSQEGLLFLFLDNNRLIKILSCWGILRDELGKGLPFSGNNTLN